MSKKVTVRESASITITLAFIFLIFDLLFVFFVFAKYYERISENIPTKRDGMWIY